MIRHVRGPLTALLAVVTLGSVAACGSGATPAAGGGLAASASTPASTAAAPSTAQRTLNQAIVATSALRSYAFAATQTVGTSTTELMGEAVRPWAVTYLLNVHGKRLQIVRLAKATYSRQVPGKWSRVARPGPAVDPVASLLGLLRSVSAPAVIGGDSSVIHGVIAASQARAAGLPAGSTAATVSVTLDPRHRVTAVVIHTTVTRAGSRPVALGLSTSYSAFNAVPAVTSPV